MHLISDCTDFFQSGNNCFQYLKFKWILLDSWYESSKYTLYLFFNILFDVGWFDCETFP